MNRRYIALVVALGLLSPLIAISVHRFGYGQELTIGFSSVESEAKSLEELKGTGI